MGDYLFQSVVGTTETDSNNSGGCCSSSPKEFNIISNGVPIAHVGKSADNSGNCEISLFNSHNTEPRTKALLIFTGYLIYYAFMAETTCGNIGARGLCKRICIYISILFMIIAVICVTIPIIVLI